MKIRLIKQSTGFGYGNQVCEWLGSNIENITLLNEFKKGNTIDVPEKTARSFHNAVDVETGVVISKYKDLKISEDKVSELYKVSDEVEEPSIDSIGDSMKTLRNTTVKLKSVESKLKSNKK